MRAALIAGAIMLVLAGCGGSADSGHASRSTLSCQQQANRIQRLLTLDIEDKVNGKQLKAAAEEAAAKALWDTMHKRHCPAASYAQLARFLNELPGG